MQITPLARGLTALLALTCAAPAFAGERYAVLPVSRLELTSGELPEVTVSAWADAARVAATEPYVVLAGPGEVFLQPPEEAARPRWRVSDPLLFTLAVAVPDGPAAEDVRGLLFVPETDASAMRRLEFRIPAGALDAERSAFLEVQAAHYEALLARELPGAAWFRYRARAARVELEGETTDAAGGATAGLRPRRPGEVEDLYELFTGGRAVSENLQLERELGFAADGEATVPLDSIPGIETEAYDWSAEVEGLEPELDPLARYVPEDQYAVFLSSFGDLLEVLDEAARDGAPLLQFVERRAEDARTRARYERQLCLPLDERTRALGPLAISSLAITGSDPYLRTGSDVAVILQSRALPVLATFVREEQVRALGEVPGATRDDGELSGVAYSGVRSPDRALCSYVARLGEDTLVVTNSTAQLARLVALSAGSGTALGDLEEYVFFRGRYVRGADDESLLVVLSDATLRRWSGPRWRIAAARRTQAAAWLADAEAARLALDAGLRTEAPPAELPDGSPIEWSSAAARSPRWGTTTFLTPIAELELERVTPAEEAAYLRFRNRYQSGWRAWFDPIALRLARRDGDLDLDLTVRPLIAGSDYRQWMEIVGDATLAPLAADPHAGSLLHFGMAIDVESEPFRFANGLLSGDRPDSVGSLFGWIGDGLGVYVESDPWFDGLRAAVAEDEMDVWIDDHLGEIPIVLHVESRDPMRMAAFLVSLRGLVDQAAPSLVHWSTKEHENHTYVRIGATPEARDSLGEMGDITLWYASLPDAFILSPREDLLLRALDRRAARGQEEPAVAPTPWRGESLALRADEGMLELLRQLASEEQSSRRQALAWSALPILREWQRLFPERDPRDVHEHAFGVRLVDPAGGEFVWDAAWHTHGSSFYGHPGAPLDGPVWPPALEAIRRADMGITFEADGLRARVLLERD